MCGDDVRPLSKYTISSNFSNNNNINKNGNNNFNEIENEKKILQEIALHTNPENISTV